MFPRIFKTCFPVVVVIFALVLAGCKQNPAEEYGDALLDSMDRGRATVNLANMKSLQDAVRMYHLENGRYPDTLEDVAGFMNSQTDFDLYNYDSRTGRVTMKKSAMIN
jgi:hypothetical protein